MTGPDPRTILTGTMVSQWAFFFDADACSGCKTCQVACKDKNDLPAGVHWRKVTEVAGGSWKKENGIWVSTVAAYNVSQSCHHCLDPVCVTACTTGSIWKREDGIVFIDPSRCIRCLQCETACPYQAIRGHPETMEMTKCDFCFDLLAVGQAPTCVDSCPNRALDFGDFEDLKKKYGPGRRVFPLPDPGETKPAFVLKPHRKTAEVEAGDPEIANWAEL